MESASGSSDDWKHCLGNHVNTLIGNHPGGQPEPAPEPEPEFSGPAGPAGNSNRFPGKTFGELGLLNNTLRATSMVTPAAGKGCTLLSVDKEAFEKCGLRKFVQQAEIEQLKCV